MVTSEREARVAAPPREAAGLQHAVYLTGVSELLGAARPRRPWSASIANGPRARARPPWRRTAPGPWWRSSLAAP